MDKTNIEKIIDSKKKKDKFCLSLSVNKESKEDFFRLIKELFPGETPSKIITGFIENSVVEMKKNRERLLNQNKRMDEEQEKRMKELSKKVEGVADT